MATAEQVITIARLREAVGEIGDESDSLLEGFRLSAIEVMEKKFNRFILDRTGYTSDPEDFYPSPQYQPDFILFSVPDIKAGNIVLKYATGEPKGQASETMTIATTDARVNLTRDRLVLYSAEGASAWSEVMRFSHPVPVITVDVGMASGDIPSAWGDAVGLYVRALYDGSAYDDLGNMTALTKMIAPWVVSYGTRSAR